MENTWSEIFKTPNNKCFYEKVYLQKIIKIPCKKLAEFNFKLLHNCLASPDIICNWNKKVQKSCLRCKETNNIKHLLFTCKTIKHVWTKTENILKCKINWKNVVLGFHDVNKLLYTRNILFTIICYTIHSKWLKHSENQKDYHCEHFSSAVAYNIMMYSKIFRELNMSFIATQLNMFATNFV